MAAGFIFAETSQTEPLAKTDRGKEFDNLPTLRRFHLAFILAAEYGKTNLLLPVSGQKISTRRQQGKPKIEVISPLPVFPPNASRNVTGHANAKPFTGLTIRPVAIGRYPWFHDKKDICYP